MTLKFKKMDLGQIITIGANLGVIAGIVFLGVELQQNNQLLKAEAGYNMLQNRVGWRERVLDQSNFAELLEKSRANQPLTSTEEFELEAYFEQNFLYWQWEFKEYREGRISIGDLPVVGWRNNSNSPRILAHWNGFSGNLDPEFVQFMQENVINPGENE